MKISGCSLVSTIGLGLTSLLFHGCSLLPYSRGHTEMHRAFIHYWPPKHGDNALKLAVKDNIDMEGVVTTAGSEFLAKSGKPAAADAPCLAIARQRGVQIVGKTNLSEFAVAPSGFNEYYGTPKSPLSHMHRLIPGGSSCGSAVAVGRGYADVSFGTDTAGSVRVPAACCGVVGLKTTHGLVPIQGVVPIEPKHMDTVGPIGKDIEHTVQGMDLLENGFQAKYETAKASKPSGASIRIGRLYVKGTNANVDKAVDAALAGAGFQVVPLGDEFRKKWEQAKRDGNTVAAVGAWLSEGKYLAMPWIGGRTRAAILVGRASYPISYYLALRRQEQWQHALRDAFHKVDLIALPTLQSTPPGIPPNLKIGILEVFMLDFQNTVAVNFAGNPALAVPIPVEHMNVDFSSLQLIGPPRQEAELLNAGRLVEAAVAKHKD